MFVSSGSGNGFIKALSGSEIELSEDYTCVITHGRRREVKETEGLKSSTAPYPSVDFLSFCYTFRKELERKDIYIYSFDCCSQEISIDEEMEKIITSSEYSPTGEEEERRR
ncbi:hypothetical protein Patl1_30361 [Pistacia atlantica]|uniref:Uncharacterized protein n=1 Tax=Pistacia atlantica TaxID=434234 RepID=A0ACC1ABB1_9ROSI|nr:hypothetical protein Patl1_30361 [Pistacia atlantica]